MQNEIFIRVGPVRKRSRILRRAQLHSGYQAAKILVALARGAQQWYARKRLVGLLAQHQISDLRSDMRLKVELLHGQVKARRAIYSIAIEQRHRRHLVCGAHLGQFLGNRSSFEEAERRAGVEFDVHTEPQIPRLGLKASLGMTVVVSVVAHIREPMPAPEVAINAIQRHAIAVSIGQRHIPLFAVPRARLIFRCASLLRIFRPPIPGGAPWSCRPQNLSLQLSPIFLDWQGAHADRSSFRYADPKLPWRTKHP